MNHFINIIFALLVLSVYSCRTTIPPRDTVDPTFNFNVQGDGFNVDINQDFDFDNKVLYLRRGAFYRMILAFNDPGGLREVYWELPHRGIIRLGERTGSGTWVVANSGDPYRAAYKWLGFETDPISNGISTYPRVEAIGGPLDGTVPNYAFDFVITDFHDNTLDKTLIVRITNEATRIGPRD